MMVNKYKRLREFATRRLFRIMLSNRSISLSFLILIPIFFVVIAGPTIMPFDPNATQPERVLIGPNTTHLLGTDHYGRDILSRVISGGRITIFVGVSAVTISTLVAIPVGIVSAYYKGIVDELIMRIMDVFISFPALILALLLVSVFGSGMWAAIVAVSIVYVPRIARIIRSSALDVRNEEFVSAAKARGESDFYIMFGEILPNVSTAIIAEATVRVGYAIIIATSLSFLGLGTQPPTADWGYMVASSYSYLFTAYHYPMGPAAALAITILGFNLLGDGLSEHFDVKQ